jgi:hypothetical protein
MNEIMEVLSPILGDELAKDIIRYRNSLGRVKSFDVYRAKITLRLLMQSPDPRLAAWEYLHRAANSKSLTVEYVKACVHYDPETGIFTARLSRQNSPAGRVLGTLGSHGYLSTSLAGHSVLLHRLAWFYEFGVWPEATDHIDRDRLNNRLANLRGCSLQENNWNLPQHPNNKSGFTGVTWDNRKHKWFASIRVGGKTKSLGRFTEKEDASAAYQRAVAEHRGHFLGDAA